MQNGECGMRNEGPGRFAEGMSGRPVPTEGGAGVGPCGEEAEDG